MSGLARLYLHEGATVTGSDAHESALTSKLEAEGIAVSYSQVPKNITDDIDLVVFTEAMSKDHPELVTAREKSIRTINYFEALSEVANEYYLIAVSGTHGKSTTTAMLIDILEEASFDPSAIVGSIRSKTGSNFRAGKSKYMVVEACEYKRDFLYLNPDILVITNIEHEHVDYYKDLEDVQNAFHELAEKVPKEGAVIVASASPSIVPVVKGITARIIDYRIEVPKARLLHQPGLHNRMNAAAARATALFLGIDAEIITVALENFSGIARRFEYKGDVNGAKVYDDYAHHPTEIAASIAAAREVGQDKKLTVIFQPHTYTRTSELFDDFVHALRKADRVLVVPIYAAREDNIAGVSSEKIVSSLQALGVAAEHLHTLDAAALSIKESVDLDDLVVVMGAGDVTKVASILTD